MAYAGKAGQPRTKTRVATARPRTGTLAAGIAAGLLVGVGLALLLAPQSGRDARRLLGRGLRRVTRRGRDAWDDLGHELHRARRQLRRARRLRSEVTDAATEALPGD